MYIINPQFDLFISDIKSKMKPPSRNKKTPTTFKFDSDHVLGSARVSSTEKRYKKRTRKGRPGKLRSLTQEMLILQMMLLKLLTVQLELKLPMRLPKSLAAKLSIRNRMFFRVRNL